MAHTTVATSAEAVQTIKGSRFLARVAPVDTKEDAHAHVADARRRWPDASHHCSAWRIGPAMATDDDGEPAGTAGRPMLEVVLRRDLDRLAIVCVRWFGGTKLGAGGLLRAYGGTAAKAFDAAGERVVPDTVAASVHVPYPRLDVTHRLLDGWNGLVKGEVVYGPTGAVIHVVLLQCDEAALRTRLADVSAGEVTLTTGHE